MLEPWFLGSRISKGFGPTISRSWVLWSQRTFSNHFFKFGCFFRYHTQFFLKKWVWFSGAEFNSKSIGTKLKFQNSRIKKFVWQFLFVLLQFLAILINFRFLFFRGTFPNCWEFHFGLVGSRKISKNWRKKIRRLSREEPILEPKQKNVISLYNVENNVIISLYNVMKLCNVMK